MQHSLPAPAAAIAGNRRITTRAERLLTPAELIGRRIYVFRAQKVMLDSDLAELYRVPTFRLNEAVKRNLKRFPEDFMFQLLKEEANSLTSQIAMSKVVVDGALFPMPLPSTVWRCSPPSSTANARCR